MLSALRNAREVVCQVGKGASWPTVEMLANEVIRLHRMINDPQTEQFEEAVKIEAARLQDRYNEGQQTPEQWLYLAGTLGGNALEAQRAGDTQRCKLHIISMAAAVHNWFFKIQGKNCG